MPLDHVQCPAPRRFGSQSTRESGCGFTGGHIAGLPQLSIVLIVTARGSAAGIEQQLAGSPRLVRTAGSGERVVYRYQPQG